MTFFIGLLVFGMVLVSIALIFLVLIQLPKKEAGAGVAFGGGATDALFGAGSGNVLTRVTKWAAILFFGLALFIGILQKYAGASASGDNFKKQVEQSVTQPMPAPAPAPTTAPAVAPTTTPPTTTPNTAPAVTPAGNPTNK